MKEDVKESSFAKRHAFQLDGVSRRNFEYVLPLYKDQWTSQCLCFPERLRNRRHRRMVGLVSLGGSGTKNFD